MERQEYLENLRDAVNAFLKKQTSSNKKRVLELAEQRASIGLKHFQAEKAWGQLNIFELACTMQPIKKKKLTRKMAIAAHRRPL
ncbi:MAG: hypothetical protein V1494_01795 [Candidatus Diapherotrites archaeon]